ncbi:hypothetical protein CPB83DRAFT_842162 [Crepidotus variabilis]|uniref:DRBM domain-containing protein n=1 Tax=Crepidotus variabilis TaxID=179855 RepID=A0A9P6EVA4_9AGAR|nr:hypothetical protein CPB83DRAFT_842162 [Crepidotus variabilis]
MTGLPSLPRIDADYDLLLDVYTHKSIATPDAPLNEKYGNVDRLALLGQEVFELAVTFHLFSKRPCIDMEEFQQTKAEYTSPRHAVEWLESYGLKAKLRIDLNSRAAVLENDDEMHKYFHTYVGAAYYQNGLQVVQDWISGLLDPENPAPQHPKDPQALPQAGSHQTMGSFHSVPLFANYQQGFQAPGRYGGHYSAPQPTGAPPPLPGSPPPPSPMSTMSSGAMSLVTVALVNQTAAQKNVSITYPATPEGPSHQPLWTVRCCIDNVERGIGRGKSQKLAKEEAARALFHGRSCILCLYPVLLKVIQVGAPIIFSTLFSCYHVLLSLLSPAMSMSVGSSYSGP